MRTVIDLSPAEARAFFLRGESYTNIDLPDYLSFEPFLTELEKQMKEMELEPSSWLKNAKKLEGVNYIIYSNKDGKYAWRRLELIHPVIYLSLLNTLLDDRNWETLKTVLGGTSANSPISCVSLPQLSTKGRQKAVQISSWLEHVEKKSIELALQFDYLFHSDIADCYASIYTHTIPWAIHGKQASKKGQGPELFGNIIDWHLQAMTYGQTNGIAQGSVLMDFVSELVLNYVDKELLLKNDSTKIGRSEYRILRYRDDYRIFVRNQSHGHVILRNLSEALAEIGMHLNTAKTTSSENIIHGAIKADKLEVSTIYNDKSMKTFSLRNKLLIINTVSHKHPNGGAVVGLLDKILQNLGSFKQNDVEEFTSILINISAGSPRCFPQVAAIVSRLMKLMSTTTKEKLFERMVRKINLLPNSGLVEIWLQRISYPSHIRVVYNEPLCAHIEGSLSPLFNSEWVGDRVVKQLIDTARFIDQSKLDKKGTIIDRKEVSVFGHYPF